MKIIFLSLALFLFTRAGSQVSDSIEFEEMRAMERAMYASLELGIALPDFTAKDLNGKTYTINSVRSADVTFVNLWFASCIPCIEEIPQLNSLYDRMKDSAGFQFFAFTYEKEAKAKEAIEKYDIRFPVLLVSHKQAGQLIFGRGYPTNMLIDKKGKIRSILSGLMNNGFGNYWTQEIEKLVKKQNSDKVVKPVPIPNSPDIVFIDPPSTFQTFDALADYFKGQSFFIDLWEASCVGCRRDFRLKNSVDSFLYSHKITRVFISTDSLNARETWKDLVYKNQLKGYHLLAGAELMKDIKQQIRLKGPMEFHRYILVQNGKIIESDYFRPGDNQKLLTQLKEKLL